MAWAYEPIPTGVRDGLAAAGYEILDADQLNEWMEARIADHGASVVVSCSDVVPDTVAKTYTADCTLRQYLDGGGKIVVYGDIPFWNLGHADNTRTNWWEYGLAGVLDIPGMNWRNDTSSEVTITDAGVEWGLTESWISRRWTPVGNPDEFTVLATDSAGNAAAWVKHFVPGDTSRGFVRLWDSHGSPGEIHGPSIEDLQRAAEYGLPGYPLARVPGPPDGSIHAQTSVNLSWTAGAFATSHDVYLDEHFDDVAESSELGDGFEANGGAIGKPRSRWPPVALVCEKADRTLLNDFQLVFTDM